MRGCLAKGGDALVDLAGLGGGVALGVHQRGGEDVEQAHLLLGGLGGIGQARH